MPQSIFVAALYMYNVPDTSLFTCIWRTLNPTFMLVEPGKHKENVS